jgi:hypothetical protein
MTAVPVCATKLKVTALVTVKPTHEPQVKNGEQPGHSFSLTGNLFAVSFFVAGFAWQSLSAQHGIADNSITYTDNIRQSSFMRQNYSLYDIWPNDLGNIWSTHTSASQELMLSIQSTYHN